MHSIPTTSTGPTTTVTFAPEGSRNFWQIVEARKALAKAIAFEVDADGYIHVTLPAVVSVVDDGSGTGQVAFAFIGGKSK